MTTKTLPTYWVKIYLSGPIEVAAQVIREECMAEGLCVTLTPTRFIYTGGEESGYVVGLIDYPRFPSGKDKVRSRAEFLAHELIKKTHQHSALVQDAETTKWITSREDS